MVVFVNGISQKDIQMNSRLHLFNRNAIDHRIFTRNLLANQTKDGKHEVHFFQRIINKLVQYIER